MKRLFSALLATVFAFSSFTLSASALESKHIKNADTSAVVEYQYVPSHFNKDAVGSIDDVIFENVADASTIAAPTLQKNRCLYYQGLTHQQANLIYREKSGLKILRNIWKHFTVNLYQM